MAKHNITDSALLVNRSRKTIQRYIASTKIKVERDSSGNPKIDTNELIRVFGKLSPMSQDKTITTSQNVAPVNDTRIDELLLAVKRLDKLINEQSEQIASLLQVEHKPINKPVHNIQVTKDQPETLKPSNTPPKPKTITPSKNDGYAAKHGLPRNITEELHIKIMELSKQGLSGNKIADILPVSKATINRVINISK
jgi:hypothetical protein